MLSMSGLLSSEFRIRTSQTLSRSYHTSYLRGITKVGSTHSAMSIYLCLSLSGNQADTATSPIGPRNFVHT